MKLLELDGQLNVRIDPTQEGGMPLKGVSYRLLKLKQELEALGCEVDMRIHVSECLTCSKCGRRMWIVGDATRQVGEAEAFYYLWRCDCGHQQVYDLVEAL